MSSVSRRQVRRRHGSRVPARALPRGPRKQRRLCRHLAVPGERGGEAPARLCPADPAPKPRPAPRGTARAPVTGSFPSARRRRQVDFALSGIGSLGLPGEDSNPYNGDQNPASCH